MQTWAHACFGGVSALLVLVITHLCAGLADEKEMKAVRELIFWLFVLFWTLMYWFLACVDAEIPIKKKRPKLEVSPRIPCDTHAVGRNQLLLRRIRPVAAGEGPV